ncbi:MAG: hypothetical protein HQ567_12675 [Candidatus Nealsonbacteria bacterium]|nr:hypothetical protein [Candidatus Nealsonbacteria bacterium]
MYKPAFLTLAVGIILLGGDVLHCNERAHAQLLRRLQSRRAERFHTQHHSNARLSPADAGWIHDNMNHSLKNSVGLGLSTVHEGLGKVKSGYDVANSTNKFFNSGTPGNPLKAMGAIVGADSIVSGLLTQAGVGPQAAFITQFAETATDFTMGKHDEATSRLRTRIAQQHLNKYRLSGNAKDLTRAAIAARPDATYRQLKDWNTRKPLVVAPHPGVSGRRPSTAISDLAKSWKTTVSKQPFKTSATNPLQRTQDWTRWKFDQNNITAHGTFDRTFHSPNGTGHLHIQNSQTGYGYQPGTTKRYEQSHYQFRGTQRQSNSTLNRSFSRPSFSQPSFSRPSFSRPSFSRPSFSRPSFNSSSISRPSTSFR